MWTVAVVTIFANVMTFFTIKCVCDFDYTTTFKVFSLDTEDSEKAKTADLANFVWKIQRM